MMMLASIITSTAFLTPSPHFTTTFFSRTAIRCSAAVPDQLDATIDELLEISKPEALPALLGRRLEVLTDARFIPRLEARRAASPTEYEATQLLQLGEFVVDFLEEVTSQVRDLEPELAAAQAEADVITKQAEADAKPICTETTSFSFDPPTPGRGRAKSTPPPPAASTGKEVDHEGLSQAEREKRAKNRFLLEKLLDAAGVSTDRLDALLVEERNKLDANFFAHLQWEIDEQKRMKNSKLLGILEVVVQRACVEVETGQPEVALLSAVLQTANQMARREMYQRELVLPRDGQRVADAFVALVTETQLELEKRVLRGELVDQSLLQMLRVISLEAGEYASDE